MAKPPYFPTYVHDTLSAPWLAALRPEQLGALFLLRLYQWDDPTCTLPDDPGILRYLSRLGDRWDEFGPDLVRLCFEKHDGRIWQEDLRLARQKYDAAVKAGKKGGVKSGGSRRKTIEGSGKGQARVRQPPPQGAAKGEATKLNKKYEILQTDNGNESAPVGASKPWTSEAIDDLRELRGEPGQREGRILAALKPVVDRYTWPRVRPVWRRYLGSDDGKFGPEHFASNFLALEVKSRASPPRGDGATWEPYGPVPGSEEWKANVEKARRGIE